MIVLKNCKLVPQLVEDYNGKWADFVVVDGDPVNDITVMYTKPVHVIKKGTVIR